MNSEPRVATDDRLRDDRRTVFDFHARLAAIAALAFCGLALAQPVERHSSGDIERRDADRSVVVRSGVLQIEIAPGMVLSAATGAQFRLSESETPRALELLVDAGSVRVVMTEAGAFYELEKGRYRVQPDASALAIADASPPLEALDLKDLSLRHSVVLADSAMLRQDRLLQVDTRQFVRGLLGLFRR